MSNGSIAFLFGGGFVAFFLLPILKSSQLVNTYLQMTVELGSHPLYLSSAAAAAMAPLLD